MTKLLKTISYGRKTGTDSATGKATYINTPIGAIFEKDGRQFMKINLMPTDGTTMFSIHEVKETAAP